MRRSTGKHCLKGICKLLCSHTCTNGGGKLFELIANDGRCRDVDPRRGRLARGLAQHKLRQMRLGCPDLTIVDDTLHQSCQMFTAQTGHQLLPDLRIIVAPVLTILIIGVVVGRQRVNRTVAGLVGATYKDVVGTIEPVVFLPVLIRELRHHHPIVGQINVHAKCRVRFGCDLDGNAIAQSDLGVQAPGCCIEALHLFGWVAGSDIEL